MCQLEPLRARAAQAETQLQVKDTLRKLENLMDVACWWCAGSHLGKPGQAGGAGGSEHCRGSGRQYLTQLPCAGVAAETRSLKRRGCTTCHIKDSRLLYEMPGGSAQNPAIGG